MKLAGTSRRPNVATSGQHEEDVNKRQRRDVSVISPSQSLKEKRDQNSRASKIVRTKARKAEQ